MTSHPGQRGEGRLNLTVRATVHAAGGRLVGGRIRNISPAGACIEHAGELRSGDSVSVELSATKRRSAEVIWATERLAGISFSAEDSNGSARSDAAASRGDRLRTVAALAAVLVTSSAIYAGLGRLLWRSFGP